MPFKIDGDALFNRPYVDDLDSAEVKGQKSVKCAMEIAAAGNHNVLTLVAIKGLCKN